MIRKDREPISDARSHPVVPCPKGKGTMRGDGKSVSQQQVGVSASEICHAGAWRSMENDAWICHDTSEAQHGRGRLCLQDGGGGCGVDLVMGSGSGRSDRWCVPVSGDPGLSHLARRWGMLSVGLFGIGRIQRFSVPPGGSGKDAKGRALAWACAAGYIGPSGPPGWARRSWATPGDAGEGAREHRGPAGRGRSGS